MRRLSGDDESFAGSVVGLGAVGLFTRVVLDVEPTYDVRQDVFENLPWSELEANFRAIISSAYSVSLFTDLGAPAVSRVWAVNPWAVNPWAVNPLGGQPLGGQPLGGQPLVDQPLDDPTLLDLPQGDSGRGNPRPDDPLPDQ